jgi:hypothetical protein
VQSRLCAVRAFTLVGDGLSKRSGSSLKLALVAKHDARENAIAVAARTHHWAVIGAELGRRVEESLGRPEVLRVQLFGRHRDERRNSRMLTLVSSAKSLAARFIAPIDAIASPVAAKAGGLRALVAIKHQIAAISQLVILRVTGE